MPDQDPHKLADQLDQEAEKLGRESRELQQRLEQAREDWQRKRLDESVPGAPPPEHGDERTEDPPADV